MQVEDERYSKAESLWINKIENGKVHLHNNQKQMLSTLWFLKYNLETTIATASTHAAYSIDMHHMTC